MTVRVRFAPSPTGRLHLGNARIALINYLFARHAGGAFVLRVDDTDRERSRDEFTDAIRADLEWLGLDWDEEFHQSARLDRYHRAMERLKATFRAYPCYESADELERKRKRQLGQGKPPIYDRAALSLSPEERERLEAEGSKPHWRFMLEPGEVEWNDLVRGPCRYRSAHLSDPVLMREDGVPLYTLTSVVDDIEFGISHVIRGEDHVTNTVPQIDLFRALHAAPPLFAHLPLMVDAQGKGLSKRLESLTLEALRNQGIEAMAINWLLGREGTIDIAEPPQTLSELVDRFITAWEAIEPARDVAAMVEAKALGHLGEGKMRFDPAELDHLNARLLHAMSFARAQPRLQALGLAADEPFWLAVRGNLKRLADVEDWWAVCRAQVTPAVEDPDYARLAATLLPPEPWGADTWRDWTQAVGRAAGRKGRDLYHPLRLALTGRGDGPELAALLPLIGRARAAARLEGRTA